MSMNIFTPDQVDLILRNGFAQFTNNTGSPGTVSPLTNGRLLVSSSGKIVAGGTDATVANIASNNAHRVSDGKTHTDVVLNNTHRVLTTGNPHVVTKEDVDMGTTDSPEFAGLIINGNSILDGALQHDGSTAGFYAAAPTTQPAAIADATDAASVITQLNDLLAKLRTLGIIAT